jgi:hypothetical protein
MSIEELLRPRYKVTADYFYNPYKLGDVITVEYDDRSVHLTTTTYRNEFGETVEQANHFHPNRLKDFPHLFQLLQWWEERSEDEIPSYVKDKRDGEVYKLVTQGTNALDQVLISHPQSTLVKTGLGVWASLYDLLPATEAEYTAYITQTK